MKILESIKKVSTDVARKIVRHEIVYEFLTFVLVLISLYFMIMGGLMMVLFTDSPLRSVYSNSMKHYDENSWKRPFYQKGVDTSNFPLQGGFERGDLLLIRGTDPTEIKLGDVIVYRRGSDLIVHRVVEIRADNANNLMFITKGDANMWFDSPPVRSDQIVGKVLFVIPKLGWPSIWWR